MLYLCAKYTYQPLSRYSPICEDYDQRLQVFDLINQYWIAKKTNIYTQDVITIMLLCIKNGKVISNRS